MLRGFFDPQGIAVVGASRDPRKVGGAVFRNLLAGGYTGPVYPVNPHAGEIAGLPAYASVSETPDPVDLAVVAVPAAACIKVIEDCGRRGISAAVVMSAGFRESGPQGAALERELMEAARAGGVRVLGPNSLGLIVTQKRMNASFAPSMPERGKISFLSQSGALGAAIIDWSCMQGIGFAHFVSLGNKADISEKDLVDTWASDSDAGVVVAYLEAVSDGRAFVESVRRLVQRTPFAALMAGTTDAGARAVSSHTGSLAGSRAVYDAALMKAGGVRVETVQELFDLAEGLARQPLPRGTGTAILTNAGGPAILAADACVEHGLALASLNPSTVASLRSALPPAASLCNPIDILGDASAERFARAARVLSEDPNVASLIVVLTPQAMTDPVATAHAIVDVARSSRITMLASFMGGHAVADAVKVLRDGGVPSYEFPERAVVTLSAMERQAARRARHPGAPPRIEADVETVREAIAHARVAGRTFITESSAARVAQAYGIRVPRGGLARDLASARSLAAAIGYPVVMKVASPDVLHKTDIGGIVFGISSEQQVDEAYDAIMRSVLQRLPDATIWGVMIQEQLPPGREVIVGMNRDRSFGPILLFGLGGIYVEVLKDVSFRMCPVALDEAREMIDEIRGSAILRGARGVAPADIDAVTDVICKVSAMAMDFPDIAELDINPLIVGDRGAGAFAADVRIGIGG